MKRINKFIQDAVRYFSRMEDDDLVDLLHDSDPASEQAKTITESILILLNAMKNNSTSDEERSVLSSLIQDIKYIEPSLSNKLSY